MTGRERISGIARRAAVAVAVVSVAAAGVAGIAQSGRTDDVRIVSSSAYPLTGEPREMAQFPTNAIAVRGHVVGSDDARWNTVDGAAPAVPQTHHYVFTPVHVRVDDLLGGTGLVAGQTFTTRRYDGRVGDVRYVSEHGRPLLRKGAEVVLLLQAPHALADGRTDLIANVVYAVSDGRLTDGEGRQHGTVAELAALLDATPRW